MTSSPPANDALFISRHCIQQCLHAAQQAEALADDRPYFGLLGGTDQCFTAILPLPVALLSHAADVPTALIDSARTFCREFTLTACFVTRDHDAEAAARLRHTLTNWLQQHDIRTASVYAELEMSHKGRIEIHCYASGGAHEIPLTMREDGTLYPQTASH
ncbi:MAG: hypothetical protein R8L58_05185 [Mariprofundaceae bacterium]